MSTRGNLAAVALVLIHFAGCATGERGPSPSPAAAPPGPQAEAPKGATPPPAPSIPPAAAPASAPAAAPGSLTLDDALRAAFARNPDLATIRQSEEVSRAALAVAGTYPHNPQVAVDVRPFTRDSSGESGEVFVSVSVLQEVELARQGRYRREEGEADLDRTRSVIQDQESKVVAETSRRFFTALSRRAMRELNETEAKLKEDLLGIVERRFQAGLAVAGDLALARVEARSTRQQLDLSKAREEIALQDLRKQIGLGAEEPLQPLGDLEGWTWPTAVQAQPPRAEDRSLLLASLEEMAVARPDIRTAEAELKARSARTDLASASRIPNIALGPVYEKDESGTSFLGVVSQFSLPIFSSGGPLVRQRQAEVREEVETLNQLKAKARLEVRAALERYEAAWRLSEQFRRDLTEGFEPELLRMRSHFDAGQMSILEVYVAWANVQKGRANLLDAQFELALSAVDLSAAAALPPEALLIPKPAGASQK